MSLRHLFAMFSVFVLVGLTAVACRPDFPNCDTDEHCQESEEGQEQDRLYCVNGLCQQCAEDEHCDRGEECAAGECQQIPGWCETDDDCEGNRVCRNNQCGPECRDDDDCDGDLVCEGGSCVEDTSCTIDDDCPGDQVCERGECVAAPTCDLETINFPFDSSRLTSQARRTLEHNAECIQDRNISVQIEGHCDERGTTEYNMALGERRANSVRDFLVSMGVSSDQISTTSYGDQRLQRSCGLDGPESCHEANRRAEFNIR